MQANGGGPGIPVYVTDTGRFVVAVGTVGRSGTYTCYCIHVQMYIHIIFV